MKQLFFLSGLPRTGSTVLASILNQHPLIFASATSPLMDFLCATERSLNNLRSQYVLEDSEQEFNIYSGIIDSFYKHIPKSIIFDKHRGWPRNGVTLKRYVANPKIVCTVRPIAEVIASYISLIEKNPGDRNFVDRALIEQRRPLTTENRAMLLWSEYVQDPYQSVLAGLKSIADCMLVVSYHDLVSNPTAVLGKIFDFTGTPPYGDFDFSRIANLTPEKDADGWGMPGLHVIRPELNAVSRPPREVLGSGLADYFRQFDLPV